MALFLRSMGVNIDSSEMEWIGYYHCSVDKYLAKHHTHFNATNTHNHSSCGLKRSLLGFKRHRHSRVCCILIMDKESCWMNLVGLLLVLRQRITSNCEKNLLHRQVNTSDGHLLSDSAPFESAKTPVRYSRTFQTHPSWKLSE